jgi:hypothetical protein
MEKKRNGKKSVVSRVWTLNLMDQKFSPLPTKLMIGFGLLDAFNFFTLSLPSAYVSPPRQLTGCPHSPQKSAAAGVRTRTCKVGTSHFYHCATSLFVILLRIKFYLCLQSFVNFKKVNTFVRTEPLGFEPRSWEFESCSSPLRS